MSSVAKIIELTAESGESFDDAVHQAYQEAKKTVDNIKTLWVKNMTAIVENEEIARYRVDVKVTFMVRGNQ